MESLTNLPSLDEPRKGVPLHLRPEITKEALDALLDAKTAAEKHSAEVEATMENADGLLKALILEYGHRETDDVTALRVPNRATMAAAGIQGINYEQIPGTRDHILRVTR